MSKYSDFNPACHMELEEEVSEEEPDEEIDPFAVIEEAEANSNKLEVTRVRNINKLWIHIEPTGSDFYMAMVDALTEGLNALNVF